MSVRSYTVSEIDQMRKDVGTLVEGARYWQYNGHCFTSCGYGYNEAERKAHVEDRLRTYMMASVDPAELARLVAHQRADEQRQQEHVKARWEAAVAEGRDPRSMPL